MRSPSRYALPALLAMLTAATVCGIAGAEPSGVPAGPAGTPPAALPTKPTSTRTAGGSRELPPVLSVRPRIGGGLSLNKAVEIALRESPAVRGAVLEVEAAVGRVEAARAERRPWASLNTFVSGGSAPNILDSPAAVQPKISMGVPGQAFFDQNISLMFPLFTGGRLRAMVVQARALRGASQAELETTRQDVALMVRIAYREVQARRSLVTVARAALDQNRERQRIDQIAFEQQRIPRFYVLRDAAEVANAEQMLTNADRDVEIGLIQLKTLMGVHLESELELIDSLGFESSAALLAALGAGEPGRPAGSAGGGAPDPQLRRLLETAQKNRSELTAAGFRREAGQADVEAARSAYRPQVGIGVMGDLMKMKGEPLFGGATFGFTASLPILDGGLRRARLGTARAETRRLDEERQLAALQVQQETAIALTTLRAAERNVGTARAAVTAAEEDYRIALLRYTSGLSIIVEALDALSAQVRAQSNEVRALFEYNVARDQLARAVGAVPGTRAAVPSPAPSAR